MSRAWREMSAMYIWVKRITEENIMKDYSWHTETANRGGTHFSSVSVLHYNSNYYWFHILKSSCTVYRYKKDKKLWLLSYNLIATSYCLIPAVNLLWKAQSTFGCSPQHSYWPRGSGGPSSVCSVCKHCERNSKLSVKWREIEQNKMLTASTLQEKQ